MKRKLSLFFILMECFFSAIFIVVMVCGCATQKGLIEKSGEWDQITDGEYLVENCTWNVSAAQSKWQETIFCDTLIGSRGWKWDFSGENDESPAYVVKTFPEIIFGRKPFDKYRATTTRLPVELASAKFQLEWTSMRSMPTGCTILRPISPSRTAGIPARQTFVRSS